MSIFAKIVAIVVGVVLITTPASATISCGASAVPMNSTSCCAGIAKTMKVHQADSTDAGSRSTLSQPSCCKSLSDDSSTQTIAREARRSATDTVPTAEATLVVRAIPPSPSRENHQLVDRPISSQVHSILCTFRI
jgi:hypothetical protein